MVTLVTGFKPIDCLKGKGLISIGKASKEMFGAGGMDLEFLACSRFAFLALDVVPLVHKNL